MMHRMMMTILLLLVSTVLMTGCSILGQPVAEKVASAVDKYCEEPYSARQLYRTTVNEELALEGHTVTVTCFGDPDPQSRLQRQRHDVVVGLRARASLVSLNRKPET